MKKALYILVIIIQISCSHKPSLIQEAIANSDIKSVQKFLSAGNEINKNYHGYPLLAYAIKVNADQKLIEYLLDQGADINEFNKGRKSPLMYAAKYSRNDLIPFLISKGAKVNLQNKSRANALTYAIKYENAEGLRKLIELGGDVHLKLDDEHTILDFAKEQNSKEIFAVLNLEYKIKLSVDGPYVFYKNDSIQSITVEENNSLFEIKKRYIPNKKQSIKVTVDNNDKEQFTVQLQETLDIPKTSYTEPEKLAAISDIEGNFYALKKFLVGSGVMNTHYEWIFGKGHLVLVGDFFDRGKNVTQSLWLLYDLERQAKENGGMVHFIIGNHEMMNLSGDNRYVKTKYKDLALSLDMTTKMLYGENTELGRWLRTKNSVEKIGNTVYVHGGLSKRLADENFSLQEINDLSRTYYGASNKEIAKNNRAKGVFSANAGPLWYRGYFTDDLPQSELDYITTYYDSDHIVVGHTPVKSIQQMYNNKVIAIDLKHPKSIKKGLVYGLLKQENIFYIINELGEMHPL
ncbi:ankyrin repeat domain-containing protein [Aquimarina sp. SS2-1]|uniref:ankyrin repeat domain-containing protein n=1 Tax=Aquimarina besae TaxID=3342247 RepID=UPI00366FF90F